MAKRGRKPIVIDWDEFEALCAIQATLREMAMVFKCDEKTVQRAVQRHYKMNFGAIFAEKRQRGSIPLRRTMWQATLAGNTGLLVFLGKQYLDMADQLQVRLPGQPNVNQRDLSRLTDEQLVLQRYLSAIAHGEQLTSEQLALQRRLAAIAAGERPALPAAPIEGSGESPGEPADGAGSGSGDVPPAPPPVRPTDQTSVPARGRIKIPGEAPTGVWTSRS